MTEMTPERRARFMTSQSDIRIIDATTEQAAEFSGKYGHINFRPTQAMAAAAARGLELRKKHKRGGTSVGVARARDLMNRATLSPSTVRRMHSFFSRHEVDKKAKGFRPGEEGYPSAGKIANLLWGGSPGQSWAAARVKQMNAADKKP